MAGSLTACTVPLPRICKNAVCEDQNDADLAPIVEYGDGAGRDSFDSLNGAAAKKTERAKRHWIDSAYSD